VLLPVEREAARRLLLTSSSSSASTAEDIDPSLASIRARLERLLPNDPIPPLVSSSRSTFLAGGVTEEQLMMVRRRMVLLLAHVSVSCARLFASPPLPPPSPSATSSSSPPPSEEVSRKRKPESAAVEVQRQPANKQRKLIQEDENADLGHRRRRTHGEHAQRQLRCLPAGSRGYRQATSLDNTHQVLTQLVVGHRQVSSPEKRTRLPRSMV
jgi:hypothetical protein